MEMSLNLIILIVLGLIVLAIIIYIVSTNAGRANNDIGACQAKGGSCVGVNDACPLGTSGSTFFTKGCNDGEKCCLSTETG